MACALAAFEGPLPATFTSLFPAHHTRCTGISVGHNLSMALFGGTAPMAATALLRVTHDDAAIPGVLLVLGAVLSSVGVVMARRLFHVT